MRVPRVYLDQPLLAGAELTLAKGAAHYLVSVLRLSAGNPLIVFNGNGGEYTAVLQTASNKRALITIGNYREGLKPSPLRVTLGIGLSRGERMDWLIQKAVELGVAEIIPLFTQRCEVKLAGERADKKLSHWQQIAISACEQSQRNDVPLVKTPLQFSEVFSASNAALQLILDPRASQSLCSTLAPDIAPNSILLLSGPEGGFDDTEVDLAAANKTSPVSLGPRVLRTETAPLVALSILQALLGDMT